MEELKKTTQKKDTIDNKNGNFPDFSTTDSHQKPFFPDFLEPKNFTIPTETARKFEEHIPDFLFSTEDTAKPTKEFKEYVPNLGLGTNTSQKPMENFDEQVSYELNEPEPSYDPFEDN